MVLEKNVESFSWRKFFGSFVELLPWIKSTAIFMKIAIIVFAGFMVYKTFFIPNKKQTNNIVAHSGSVINIKEDSKKALTPFVEGYGFTESGDRTGVGVKGGIRLEF